METLRYLKNKSFQIIIINRKLTKLNIESNFSEFTNKLTTYLVSNKFTIRFIFIRKTLDFHLKQHI
jgi:hypothetical protein